MLLFWAVDIFSKFLFTEASRAEHPFLELLDLLFVVESTHHRYSERGPLGHSNGISYTTGHLALVYGAHPEYPVYLPSFWISEMKDFNWVFHSTSLASATSFSLNVANTARSTSGFPDVNTSPYLVRILHT